MRKLALVLIVLLISTNFSCATDNNGNLEAESGKLNNSQFSTFNFQSDTDLSPNSPIALSPNTQTFQLSNEGMTTFNENNLWGLKDADGNVTVEPQFKKLIRLGKSSWIVQKRTKYGLMDSYGNYLILPQYRHVDRLFNSYVKFGNDINFGVYDEKGDAVIPPEYSSINPLFGKMFVTCKNYKYGLVDRDGNIILENKFDKIYMPNLHTMRLQYGGQWYEIERLKGEDFDFPKNIQCLENTTDLKVSDFIESPVVASGYSAITFTDYVLKLFASISPAHEETVDELMFSQGADMVSIYMKFSWLPKYPFTYAKKYYSYVRTPNNGPLNRAKEKLKQKMN